MTTTPIPAPLDKPPFPANMVCQTGHISLRCDWPECKCKRPTPAPSYSAEELEILWRTAHTWADERFLATLTARDETIAGLTRERDAANNVSLNSQREFSKELDEWRKFKARAETAESRITVLEEALLGAIYEDDNGWNCPVCDGVGDDATHVEHEPGCLLASLSPPTQGGNGD